jgi:hypothetical protein
LRERISIFQKKIDQELEISYVSSSFNSAESKLSAQESQITKLKNVNADLQKQNVELVAGQNAMTAELV